MTSLEMKQTRGHSADYYLYALTHFLFYYVSAEITLLTLQEQFVSPQKKMVHRCFDFFRGRRCGYLFFALPENSLHFLVARKFVKQSNYERMKASFA
jgi:hypothetical protein